MPARRSSKRHSRPHRRGPHTSPAPLSTPQGQATPRSPSATPFDEELWNALRQGARNVAGVRYQLAVTALLLADSRRRFLPFVELVPEGYEDIDCLDRESTHWLIQVKEFGAGAGTFTASSIAEVISHAASAPLTPARIVAITDGQLGVQLAESGWNRAVSETPGYDTQSTVAALTQRGFSNADANTLMMRTHLITYPWNTVPLLTHSIAQTYDVKPAVAALIAGRLVDSLGQIAADQRSTTGSSVGRYRLADLDSLVQRTLTVVDVHALDSAIRFGVCDIADYTGRPATNQSRFLQGIDAIPAHIGSGFDVLRPTPCRAVQHAIETARYALVAGPIGIRQVNPSVAISTRRRDSCAGHSSSSRRDRPRCCRTRSTRSTPRAQRYPFRRRMLRRPWPATNPCVAAGRTTSARVARRRASWGRSARGLHC